MKCIFMRFLKYSFFIGILALGLFSGNDALGYSPVLSIVNNGNNLSVSVAGANPNSSIQLSYTPSGSSLPTTVSNFGTTDFGGNYNTNIVSGSYGLSGSSQIYVTVGGVQSNIVSVINYGSSNGGYNGGNYGCGYYNCSNGSYLSLSQNNVNLNVGQSMTVSVSNLYYNSLYVSSNSNSSVVDASVSGTSVYLYGRSSGSSTVVVCNGGNCGTIYVTVSGSGGTCYSGTYCGNLSLSQNNLNLNVGQSASVNIYNYSSGVYISSNSNPNVATASVSGSQVSVYGNNSGSSTISICANYGSSQCASLYVTVGGGSSYGNLSFSQNSVTVSAGQTTYVTSYNYYGNLYISSNSNPSVVTASVSSNQVSFYGLAQGSSTVVVCASNSSQCANLYVTVNGYGGGSGLTLNQTTVNLSIGQTSYISATNYSGTNLYVSSNSNPSVVSATASGSNINLNALAQGNSTVVVCANYSNACASVYVTVGGYGGNSLNFSNVNPILSVGQSSVITISNGYYSNYIITGNTNQNVATASVYGSNLNIYGVSSGNTTITVCSGSGTQCGSIYVSVGNGSGGLFLSQTTLNLTQYQTSTVTTYGNYSNSYYVSSNSNPSVATLTVYGSQISVYGNNPGFTAAVVCQSGNSQCATLSINVTSQGNYTGNLNIITPSLSSGKVNQYYNANLQASGGISPYNFYLTSGSLPQGLSLSTNGQISGTPQAAGNFNFTVQVRDNVNQISSNTFALQINSSGSGSVQGVSTFANGQLISENGTVYIVYKGTKTGFISSSVFTGLGFNFNNVVYTSNSGLWDSGYTVRTQFASHPWGTWIKSGNTIYFVHESGLIPVPDWTTFTSNGGQSAFVVPANHYDFSLPILSPMTFSDYRLN